MEPLIEFANLTFGYGAQPVLDRVNFRLYPGQFAALVGPSGAGKTTMIRLLLQLLPAGRGQIIHRPGPALRIAYVPQLETVDWNFPVTALEVVLMGLTGQNGRLFPPWSRAAEKEQAMEILARLELADLAQHHIRQLSGGQQQRIFLARALIARPDLLVLDEPTTGVDMRSAENIFHWLADLNHKGMTVLLTTHDLNMAAAHVPWIVCLRQRVIAQGAPEAVMVESVLNETYEGDMMVIRQDGLIFVQQRPHQHDYRALHPAAGDETGSQVAA